MTTTSAAVMQERVIELGLGDVWSKFEENGWNSLGTFAFAFSSVPGTGSDDAFCTEVVEKLMGTKDSPKKAAIRCLYYEAYTAATAELNRRYNRTEDDKPRKVPAAEKEVRRQTLQKRLPGLDMTEELDPSYELVDRLCQHYEDNNLIYVSWDKCTRRSQELVDIRKEKVWQPDSNGIVREVTHDHGPSADVSSDLLLEHTLRRRGLAYDMAGIMSYETHDRIAKHLMKEYLRAPLTGFARVTIEQLRRADEEIFRELQERCRTGIRRSVDGRRPVEEEVKSVLESHRISMLLMPMRGGGGSHTGSSSKRQRSASPNQRSRAQTRNDRRQSQKSSNEYGRNNDFQMGANYSKGKGKGKGGKRGKGAPVMPQELVGKDSRTAGGRPICFAYNTRQGCGNAKPGEACAKGLHVCCEPGCYEAHPVHQHRR